METTDQPAYAVPAHVLYREVDGEMVLLNLDSEQYFGLDTVGADIVTRLVEQPLDKALTTLVADYEVDPAVLRRDVDDLLAALLDVGLLERTEPPG
jgi:hypothetical protein